MTIGTYSLSPGCTFHVGKDEFFYSTATNRKSVVKERNNDSGEFKKWSLRLLDLLCAPMHTNSTSLPTAIDRFLHNYFSLGGDGTIQGGGNLNTIKRRVRASFPVRPAPSNSTQQ